MNPEWDTHLHNLLRLIGVLREDTESRLWNVSGLPEVSGSSAAFSLLVP